MANTMLKIPCTMAYPLSGTEPSLHGTTVITSPLPALISESYFKETASQSYVIGDLIYLDSNGTIAVCTTASVGGVNQLSSAILGQPDVKATGVTGQPVAFRACLPTDVYIMNVFHSTPASAVTTQAMLGTRRNIVKSAAGLWHVDIVNSVSTTVPMVVIVGFPQSGLDSTGLYVSNAGVGDINGLVYVRFKTTYTSTDDQLDALQLWN